MRKLIVALFKTGGSSIVILILNIASIKVVAVLLGPSGVGLFTLIRQTLLTLASVSQGGQTALVQGVTSKKGEDRDAYVRSVFWLFLVGTLFTVLLIEIFSPAISELLVGNKVADFTSVIRWMALPVTLLNMHVYLKGILNGFRAIGRLALVEVLGPLAMLILIYPVCILAGKGETLAFIWLLSATQFMMVLPGFLIAYRNGWLSPVIQHFIFSVDKSSMRHFFTMAGTIFVTAILGTVTLLVVRGMIIQNAGLSDSGLFDLAWTLSGSYVMLLLSSFGTYYLPTLTGTTGESDKADLICLVIRVAILLMVPMIIGMVLLKPLIVELLYTSEFLSSLELVRWMLIGDYFKITSWVLAIPALAKRDMKTYFWTETFWYVGFMLLSALSIFGCDQLQCIGIAFIILYLCLVIFYAMYVQREYRLRFDSRLIIIWSVGLLLVVMASWENWDSTIVDWKVYLFWAGICIVFLWGSLNKNEKLMLKKIRIGSWREQS
jgi:O-antigen/teichoic acid export membrane protein